MGRAVPYPPYPPRAADRPSLLAGIVVLLLALGSCVLGWVSGPAPATPQPRAGAVVAPAPPLPGRAAVRSDGAVPAPSSLRAAEDPGDAEPGAAPTEAGEAVGLASAGPAAGGAAADAPPSPLVPAAATPGAPRAPPADPLPPRVRPS